jgi:murein DD-endopeptidase MepM/ murein hydrolase activator NlpD
MISPTGKNLIRNDEMGDGHFGSKRGDRTHKGIDLLCIPGQTIVSPIHGHVVRVAQPYEDASFLGLVIRNPNISIKLFYFIPLGIVGKWVKAGEPIGTAQNIGLRYKDVNTGEVKMKPHIHMEIERIDPEPLLNLFT